MEIDRYGEYRDGITLGTLEELYFSYAKKLDAPRLNMERQRPAGYEETGGVSLDIPGVGVSVFSSRDTYHTHGMLNDALSEVGHTAFRFDAQIMAAILYDFLTNEALRQAIGEEHAQMKALYGEYQQRLREAYAPEIGTSDGNR